jgi:hypothetical protein
MPEAVMEARIAVSFDWGVVYISVDEARELIEQLEDALPQEQTERHNGGSFGFGVHREEEENENE